MKYTNLINSNLKEYIENIVLPEYSLNDKGHDIEHINYVLERAYEISKEHEINYDMLYTVVCYHDIACHINRDEHEKLSAQKLYQDEKLKMFFTEEELQIMKEAVEDHRASLEYIPRNIYGKILSSADRKIDVDSYFRASIGFEQKRNPTLSKEELINLSYNFAIKKYGKNGYAVSKMYVKDIKYENFLKELQDLIEKKEEFARKASKAVGW